MVVKGCALGPQYYRDMGARPMGDVDVVVPREHAVDALALLERHGWRAQRAAPADPRAVTRVQHAEGHTGPDGGTVDLHWQVLRQPVVEEDFYAHSVPLEVGDHLSSRTLCAADHVVHGCVHGADGGMEGVRWVPDVAVVARSGKVDWERVVDVSSRQRVAHTVAEALDYVGDVFEAPVPPETLAALRAATDRRERVAHRAATLPATRWRVLRTVWDRYRRLSEFEGRRPNPLRFPAYARLAMGFRDGRHMLRVSWRRLTGRSAARRPRDPGGRRPGRRQGAG
jgi:hypothetical protein